MQKFLNSLAPFLVLGFTIAIFCALLFLIFQIVLWGTLIGLIAWGIAVLKQKLFPSKQEKRVRRRHGIVIEHDDL